ncbi:hypothetical protein M406DRAFT_322853 [Cryphonectria parasitica EP155]|uniref:Uncharacterized protein n=1 Tax=Cryphonectria parasitica (strain ATCC 38755 / EP155) TaxID=660469 RepID=A0A9P4Y1T4_CRYP1|nr:uncharacterized protein M406DRAFT_322853 [Cryphonectria parasitica EP155]KAF3765046.1 hypothetical protein M406DRAFT_322853 [Cryphonectria parasitica EP155]
MSSFGQLQRWPRLEARLLWNRGRCPLDHNMLVRQERRLRSSLLPEAEVGRRQRGKEDDGQCGF